MTVVVHACNPITPEEAGEPESSALPWLHIQCETSLGSVRLTCTVC